MAVIGLGGCAISLRRPYIGLLMLVVLYFFRPDLWGAEAYVRPALWLTLAVTIGWYRQRRPGRPSPALRWLILLLVLYVISAAVAAMATLRGYHSVSHFGDLVAAFLQTARPVVDIAKIFAAVFLITELCDTPRKLAGVLLAFVAGSLWFVKAAVVSWALEGFSDEVRINTAIGQGGGANYIAWVLATTAPLLIYKIVRGGGWQRLLAGLLLPLWLTGILATGSRGGIACLAAGMLALVVVMRQLKLAVLLAVMGVLLLVLMPTGRFERISAVTLDPDRMDESMLIRYQHLKVGLRIIGEHPLFGTGLGTFPEVKKKYLPQEYAAADRVVAHNTIIQMGSEAGLIFLAAFIVFNFFALRCLWRRSPEVFDDEGAADMDWIRAGTAGALAATAVQMLKGDMANIDYFWWLYAISIAYHMVRRAAVDAAAAKACEPAGQAKPKRSAPPWARVRVQPGT
jgi:hypothetical protein